MVGAPIVNDKEFPIGQGLGHNGGNAPWQEIGPLKRRQNHRDQWEGVYGISIARHASSPYRRVGAFSEIQYATAKGSGQRTSHHAIAKEVSEDLVGDT